MTQALKIEENDLDKFITSLLKDHVGPIVYQLTWKTYQEFKNNYESIVIEDPREETNAKLKKSCRSISKTKS